MFSARPGLYASVQLGAVRKCLGVAWLARARGQVRQRIRPTQYDIGKTLSRLVWTRLAWVFFSSSSFFVWGGGGRGVDPVILTCMDRRNLATPKKDSHSAGSPSGPGRKDKRIGNTPEPDKLLCLSWSNHLDIRKTRALSPCLKPSCSLQMANRCPRCWRQACWISS